MTTYIIFVIHFTPLVKKKKYPGSFNPLKRVTENSGLKQWIFYTVTDALKHEIKLNTIGKESLSLYLTERTL
jgi:hypothetical protein